MLKKTISRRGFVAASAATAALAASGAALSGCASGSADEDKAFAAEVVNTQCSACPKQCGYAAYVVNGSVDKVVGNALNPYAAGTLCARGYGSATAYAAEGRLATPLRRNAAGFYDEIEWDTAIAEIAAGLEAIATEDGPMSLAAVTNGTSTADWYVGRLMAALGSPNVYVNASAANLSVASGLALATGYTAYEPDYANAAMVIILGASTVEAPDPGTAAALQQAREAGARIVMVDSRLSQAGSLATEFVAVNAGIELALVLALAHELLDDEGIAQAAAQVMTSLEQWRSAIAGCTPQWAAKITGVPADRIVDLAQGLAQAAPAACIDLSWMAMFGGSYDNTGELARAVALVNTLLGCWNVAGGAYLVQPAEWAVAPTAAGGADDITAEAFPLAVAGSPAALMRLAHDEAVRGLLLVDANVAAEYPDPDYVAEALEACELTVAVVPQMTETAALCTYVLPEKLWAESAQLPTVAGAKTPMLVVSSQVVEPAVEQARSVAEIMSDLAGALGKQSLFPASVEEAAAAMCEAAGIDYLGACRAGSVALGGTGNQTPAPASGEVQAAVIAWPTASGKVECASAAADAAGLSAVPVWVAPRASAQSAGLYRLTTGNQAVLFATELTNLAPLQAIAAEYGLDGVWMNADAAEAAGIAEGDKVVVANDRCSATARAHLTRLIEPSAAYMACHYGVKDEDEKVADGLGVRQAAFVPFALETGYGAPLLQESLVTITKAGA